MFQNGSIIHIKDYQFDNITLTTSQIELINKQDPEKSESCLVELPGFEPGSKRGIRKLSTRLAFY